MHFALLPFANCSTSLARGGRCLHSNSLVRTLLLSRPRCMYVTKINSLVSVFILYVSICIHSLLHTPHNYNEYKHKSLTLEIYTTTSLRTKNHWNNNINNCMCVCVCLALLTVFCLFNGFVLHSASASTSTRAQVSTATAIELSHKRVKWAGIAILLALPLSYHISLAAPCQAFAICILNCHRYTVSIV